MVKYFWLVKLVTVVEGDLKVLFSIATTPTCWRGHYFIPLIAPLYPWSVPYNNVKQGGIKYHFFSLWYDSNYIYIYIYIYTPPTPVELSSLAKM